MKTFTIIDEYYQVINGEITVNDAEIEAQELLDSLVPPTDPTIVRTKLADGSNLSRNQMLDLMTNDSSGAVSLNLGRITVRILWVTV